MAADQSVHVGVDIGSSSATVGLGVVDETGVSLTEVHRFDSRLISDEGPRTWDLSYLVGEILEGLARAEAEVAHIESVGIDATAGAFGFLANGRPVRDPVQAGGMSPPNISRRDLYFTTGHTRLPTSLYHTYTHERAVVEQADTLVLAPQLLGYLLGGAPVGEFTYAVSAGMGNMRTRDWAIEVFERFGLPTGILPPMRSVGAVTGTVEPREWIEGIPSVSGTPNIRIVPGHDTSAAVAAIPFRDEAAAFLATGSWFIPGYECQEPIVTAEAYAARAENVGGIEGTARFVRNLPGFSLFERLRAQWQAVGGLFEYEELVAAAQTAPAFQSLISTTDDPLAHEAGSSDPMEGLATYFERTGQPVLDSEGEITRALFESLALESAIMLDRLGRAANRSPSELRLVGGGARNALLCDFVANATGVPVITGPVEATMLGNILSQAIGAGTIPDVAAARDLVRHSVTFETHSPTAAPEWLEPRERMARLFT